MTHLNKIVNASIHNVPALDIADQFERNDCQTWYVQGDMAKSDWHIIKRLISQLRTGTQNQYDDFADKHLKSHPLLYIGGQIFSDLGKGVLDHDDEIRIYFPYNKLWKISFGEISGSVDTSGRTSLGSERPIAFHIYFAPNQYFFDEMDSKLTDPTNQSYHFYPTDLVKGKVNISEIPTRIIPSKISFMYNRVWF